MSGFSWRPDQKDPKKPLLGELCSGEKLGVRALKAPARKKETPSSKTRCVY